MTFLYSLKQVDMKLFELCVVQKVKPCHDQYNMFKVVRHIEMPKAAPIFRSQKLEMILK